MPPEPAPEPTGALLELSTLLKQLIVEANTNITRLAETIGSPRQQVSRAVNGREVPSIDLAEKLDPALDADGRVLALRERADRERRARNIGAILPADDAPQPAVNPQAPLASPPDSALGRAVTAVEVNLSRDGRPAAAGVTAGDGAWIRTLFSPEGAIQPAPERQELPASTNPAPQRGAMVEAIGTAGAAAGGGSSGSAPHDRGYDRQTELVEVGVRLRYFATPTVPSSFLDYLDDVVEDCVASYEARGPAALMPLIVRQRNEVQTLIEGWQPARARQRLLRVACRLSGLAGYMAVNLGDFRLARAYCAEAFTLARVAEDDNLAAWVRGTESLCAYYAGDYRRARDLAREGQTYAAGGPQAIRLAVNGEARALGHLGDRDGVREAVGRAFQLAGNAELPAGMTPCTSFGVYSLARIAANAATAHLAVGHTALVQSYAQTATAMAGVDRSPWSDVLISLDVATALATGDDADPEHGAALGIEALTRAGTQPIESIRQRGRELARRTTPWRSLPAVADLAEITQTLSRRPLR